MITEDFITELFYCVDEKLKDETKYSQAKLHKGKIVILGLLFALKGTSYANFYRWLKRDYLSLSRIRLFTPDSFGCLMTKLFFHS